MPTKAYDVQCLFCSFSSPIPSYSHLPPLHSLPLPLHSPPLPLPSTPLHSLPTLTPSHPSLYSHQIYRFSLDNCGVHSSCSVCVQSTNPLCGWCSTDGQCMPQNGCNLANTFTGHNNAASCPAIVSVSPMEAYIVNNVTVSCTLQY